MVQYADHPMDLADASLVALAEALKVRKFFTIDRGDYNSLYHEAAQRELEQRGTSVDQMRSTAHVGFNDETGGLYVWI